LYHGSHMRGVETANESLIMPGLVLPARPKPLRRGEGPGIHVVRRVRCNVDGRDEPGHDELEIAVHRPRSLPAALAASAQDSATRRSKPSLRCARRLLQNQRVDATGAA